MASHDRRLSDKGHLVASASQNRPVIILTKEFIRHALHVNEVLVVRTDAAQNSKNRLNKEGRLHQPAINQVSQIVKVADVVALEFETRAAALAELFQQP